MTSDSPGRRARATWVIDVRPGGAASLGKLLRREDVRICAELPEIGAAEPGEIAIGVCPLGDIVWGRRFAEWAWSTGVSLITIAADARAALVGPLTIPARVGCGNCALERIIAASATNTFDLAAATPGVGEATDTFVADVVAAEIGTVAMTGLAQSRLLDHVIVMTADGQILGEHRVIPLPRCRVCGGAAALPRAAPRPDTNGAAGLAGGIAGWVDPLTGIIPGLVIDPPVDEPAGLPVIATAAPPQVVTPEGSLQVLPGGWGKGMTLGEAVTSAIGEALERYSASVPDPDRILWAPSAELDGDRLDPREFSLYSEEQYARAEFPFARFDPDVAHPWVRGTWLDGGEVWVPAVMCYLSLTVGPENLICQGTSNGLAASSTLEDAALHATLELVERDALLGAWVTGEHARRVRIDGSLEPSLTAVLSAIEALGGSVELYDLPSACGTTIMCIALGDGETWPGATIGLNANLDPVSAARGAILELGQTGPYLRRLLQSGTARVPSSPEAVHDLLDHATYYFPRERARAFDRLRDSQSTVPLSSLRSPGPPSLTACADALGAAGIRIALIDVTSADLAIGSFRVVRAVSPELSPLTYGYGLERLPVKRIGGRARGAQPPRIHPIW